MKGIGYVVHGSIKDGVRMILNPDESIEDYPVGSLITIQGGKHDYLALINDIGIKGSEALILELSQEREGLIKSIVRSIGDRYSVKWLDAILIAQRGDNEAVECDTFPEYTSIIPSDSNVRLEKFFDKEDGYKLWNIGMPKTPGESTVYVPIDISELIELSFGIYGKSGTGKTFLGNILAGYIVLYDKISQSMGYGYKPVHLLIFDMHSEYGLYLKDNLGKRIADGVGLICKDEFEVFSPSKELYDRYRHIAPLKIYLYSLTREDIEILSNVFGLTETFIRHLSTISYLIKKEMNLGDKWIWGLFISEHLEETLKGHVNGRELLDELRDKLGIVSFRAFRDELVDLISRKYGSAVATSFVTQTSKLYRILSYPVTVDEGNDSIGRIVDLILSREGRSVIISMGHYERELPLYMVIANLIARKIHAKLSGVEESESKVLIFLEEAHKFLGKDVFYQSPFGIVAREMRKKGVTIVVIDQRPSELDRDVVSMLWTNFIFTLTNPYDVDTSVSGTPNPNLYRRIVPRLRKRSALVYGEAIKFPVVLDIVDYKEYSRRLKRHLSEYAVNAEDIKRDLF